MSLINGFPYNNGIAKRYIINKPAEEEKEESPKTEENTENSGGEDGKETPNGGLISSGTVLDILGGTQVNNLVHNKVVIGGINLRPFAPNTGDNTFGIKPGTGSIFIKNPFVPLTESSYYEYYEDGTIKSMTVIISTGVVTSRTEYDENGNMTSHTDYRLDGSLQKKAEYANNLLTVEEFYDESGKLTSRKEYEYNEDGQIKFEKTYDEFGNLTSKKRYDYSKRDVDNDGKKDLSSVTELIETQTSTNAEGDKVVTGTYTTSGKKAFETVYHADGTITNTIYDQDGSSERVLSVTEYDSDKNMLSKTEYGYSGKYSDNPNSVSIYNENGIIVSKKEYDFSGDLEKEYEYDENGNIKTEKTYDYNDNVESEKEYYENGNVKVEKTYDYKGRIESEKEYYENGNPKSEKTYDYNGRIESEKEYYDTGVLKHEKHYSYTYKVNGLDYELEYNEKGEKILGIQYNYGYDYVSKEYVLDSTTHNIYENGVKVASQDYDLDGNMTSETTYDEDGNVTSETTFTYNADGSKTAMTHNSDGTINKKEYDADGNLTYSSWLTYYENGRVATETVYNDDGSKTVIEYTDNTYYYEGTKSAETIYDKDGNKIARTTYYASGDIYQRYEYYEDGETIKTEYYYNSETFTGYDKDGNKISEGTFDTTTGYKKEQTVYNADGTKTVETYSNNIITKAVTYDANENLLSEVYYKDGIKNREVIYSDSSYTETLLDAEGKPTKKTLNNSDGTTVVTNYENGVPVSETTYKFGSNIVIKEVVYDENGNIKDEVSYTKTEEKDGKTYVTYYDKDGNVIGNSKIYTDSNGNIREDYTAADNSKIYRYITPSDGRIHEYYYKPNGQVESENVYELNDKTYETYTYEYSEYIDSKNYTRTRTDSKGNKYTVWYADGVLQKTESVNVNGDITRTFYENGKKTKSFFYDKSKGSVKTTNYDKNGKGYTAKSKLSGSVSYGGVTLTKQQLYNGLVNPDSSVKYWTSVREIMTYMITGEFSTDDYLLTTSFLDYAQDGYNGTPKGCDKKYTNYLDTDYADFIKEDIINGLTDDGYDPEWVKGYHFPEGSDVSDKIKSSSYLKDYIKKNIKALISGDVSSLGRLDFNSGSSSTEKDLYYSLHGTDVVDSKLNGTMLTITIYDLYDYAIEGTGLSGKLNEIATAAQKDGQLVPYFMLIDVTIDLRDLFSDEELKNLGII